MLSCHEVSQLLSKQRDGPLTAGEILRLKLHLALCKPCHNVDEQLDFLREAMKRLGRDGGAPPWPPSGDDR
jgi:hypothetical protein